MKATRRCLIGLVVALAAIGMSGAPLAAADTVTCLQNGVTTVCGQGGVSGIPGHYGVLAPGGGGCINPYGTYQNCAVQQQDLFGRRSAR